MTLVPDRRPIKRVSVYNGNANHPRGIRPDMVTLDGFKSALFTELDAAYALGWRRFMLHAPAGRPHSVAAAKLGYGLYHHHHLPDDVRAMLKRDLAQWLHDRPDAVVGAYLGFAVTEAGRYHVTAESRHEPDPNDPSDRAAFLLEVEQWLAIAPEPGQIGIGLDASRNRPDFLVSWADEMRARGVWVMGEAIPEVSTNDAFSPEAYLAPWWASVAFLTATNRPHRQAQTWDPATTEVIVGFHNGTISTVEEAEAWAAKGYVLASWGVLVDDLVLAASV